MIWEAVETGKIPEPANGWFSLLILIDHYQVSALVNAIDQHGIFAIDQFGRRVQATEGDISDAYSKNYARKLLADVYAEQQNPAEEFSWHSERLEFETHPLFLFGWPKDNLPDLESFALGASANNSVNSSWRQRPFSEFEREKKEAVTYEAAAKIHGVTRQDYTRVYERQKSKAGLNLSALKKYLR
ncbi:hypothetical protein [Flavobacterium sp.]|jgi:hypothetical protein|uniref:hypothetical protein n=1 Tax=Flavobacterium sp. TaxID=239 RepID=UPI0037BF37BF